MPQTRLIDVCDREADFFELFDEQRQNPRVELLVRAKHDRNLDEEPFKLFAAARGAPVQSRMLVSVPRRSARAKKSKQKACPKRPGRLAELAVRALSIQLRQARYHADKAPIDLRVVHALEENPPAGAEAVEWFLLTAPSRWLRPPMPNSVCAGTVCAGVSKTGTAYSNPAAASRTSPTRVLTGCAARSPSIW